MSKPCDKCGGHQWSHDGYCLTLACAGHFTDPDWPLTRPKSIIPDSGKKTGKPKKVGRPRSAQGRKSAEAWYEQRGDIAPWIKEEQGNE